MLHTETYLVAIGILILALILRPAPVVVVQRDRDGSSVISWFFGLILMVGGLIWLLSRVGCSSPIAAGDDTSAQNVNMHINKSPLKSMQGWAESKEEQSKNSSRWILRVKIFTDLQSARSFVSPIPGMAVKVCKTEKGAFWAYIIVNDEAEGRKILRYWEYYQDWGLDLKVMKMEVH